MNRWLGGGCWRVKRKSCSVRLDHWLEVAAIVVSRKMLLR